MPSVLRSCLKRNRNRGVMICGLLAGTTFVRVLPLRAQSPTAGQHFQATRAATYDGLDDGLPMRTVSAGVMLNAAEYFLLDRETPVLLKVSRAKGLQVGRRGNGPGEYSAPANLTLLGDTLVVIENVSRRANFFALAGRSPGQTRHLTAPPPEGFINSAPISLTRQGTINLLSNPDGNSRVTGASNDVKLVWQSLSTAKTKILTTLSRPGVGLSVPVLIAGEKYRSAARQPFVPAPLWSASRVGSGMAVIETSTGRFGATIDITLTQWAADGQVNRICKWSEKASPLTSAAYNRGTSRLFTDKRVTVKKADIDREVTRPTYAPFATDLQFASDGAVWIRTSAQYFQESDTYLRVHAIDCSKRDVVEFGALVKVLDARGDTVLVASQVPGEAAAMIYQLAKGKRTVGALRQP